MELSVQKHRFAVLATGIAAVAIAVLLAIGAQPAQAETFHRSDGNGVTSVYSSKKAYFVDDGVLYKEVGGKWTKLKKLSASGDAYWRVTAAYKKNVYLTKSSFEKWKLWTYTYNTKTKKFKKVKTNCDIVEFKGKYAYAMHDYKSDVSGNRLDVYKLTSSGVKHVRKLTKYGFYVKAYGKKIYYTVAKDSGMHKNALYKATLSGKSKKKLFSRTSADTYGQVIITDITSKNCKVIRDSAHYLYTYKTKKMKKIAQY